MNRGYFIVFVLLFLTGIIPVHGQVYTQKPPDKTRILFLLDGSGSMLAPWGPTLRINAAKRFLADIVDSLSINLNLELALRVYGHQFHRKLQRCDDSKLEVGFGRDNHKSIIQKLNQIDPKGTTPIAYSLEQAAGDFPAKDNVRNIIILITDGLESCEGDPCEISLELQKRGIFLKPFIIGMGMDKNAVDQFNCVGQYYDATNLQEFRLALESAVDQSLDKTTVSIELTDHNERPSMTDINVTFINNFTNRPVYEFVHYRDPLGRPDSVEIDGVLSYDIRVNTVPPVYYKNPVIIPGKHNVIYIQCPQGRLQVTQKNHSDYTRGVKVLIREKNKSEILHTLDLNETHQYLSGLYDLEVTTLPGLIMEDILIEPDRLRRIDLPAPGILNVTRNFPGIGSIYQVFPDGSERWIYNLSGENLFTSHAIQPGKYKIVFRINNALGSKFTKVEPFEITSGRTANLKL
ncbi:MAG: VWA domain-containing protein [Cyclobacteriaceae bacterium]|nr:VWA domain-containing protein [Cyclobacteriaceae bacterium]